MGKIQFQRMDVLRSLFDMTSDIVSDRFISTRPNAVGERMKEFLLIRLPQNIYDRGDTYQTTHGQIAIFVRDLQNGLENTLRLEQILSQILDLFPLVTDIFHGKQPTLLYGGSDGAGFHSLIIQFNIIIFKNS